MKTSMNTKWLMTGLLISGLFATGTALADKYNDHHKRHYDRGHDRVIVVHQPAPRARWDYAPVMHARPIYQQVAISVPVESCQIETVSYRNNSRGDSFGGTVVGGLIGAAIGRELGHGSGHATAAGGLIGAAIGNDVARGGQTRYRNQEVCTTQYRTEYESRLTGYDVSYRYYGRVYHTETQRHPGDRVRIDISLHSGY